MTDELFSELWFPIKSNPDYAIPMEYFFDFSAFNARREELTNQMKIIHFAQNKPWEMSFDNELLNTPEA